MGHCGTSVWVGIVKHGLVGVFGVEDELNATSKPTAKF